MLKGRRVPDDNEGDPYGVILGADPGHLAKDNLLLTVEGVRIVQVGYLDYVLLTGSQVLHQDISSCSQLLTLMGWVAIHLFWAAYYWDSAEDVTKTIHRSCSHP